MPRKVDFHTEWAIPDPTDDNDARNDEEKPGAQGAQALDTQAAQAPKQQRNEKWFAAGRRAS
jgi:hypothetical protein